MDIDGSFDNNLLTLNETFVYRLGEGAKERVWTIKPLGDGRYKGSANDIASDAVGYSYGNAFNWQYEMDIPVGNRSYRVKFKD